MTQLFGDSSKNRKIGIALVTLTTLMFASLDTSAKWLVLSLPVLQVVWMRFFSQVLFTAAVFAPTMGWGMFRVVNLKLQCLRGLILALMTALNFLALQYLQLAETGAIQFSVPILIAVLSSWWLKEKLDVASWIAIWVGFAGVLVIIRPGSHAFHPAIFLSVMNAFLYAGFNMLTRRLAASENPVSTQLFSAAVSAVVLAPFAWSQWQTPEGVLTWVIIGLIGVFAGLGHLSVASAHRYASAAFLGPFLYQQILYMTLGGWLVFGQTPDHAVALGAVIVVASGMFLLWREMRTKVSSVL
ncbi:MAG: DMT family transporter [Limnohabitans sp.]|jgi:drug/metabolite transporter (DMT)-like permease